MLDDVGRGRGRCMSEEDWDGRDDCDPVKRREADYFIMNRATRVSEPSRSLQRHRSRTDQFLNGSVSELVTPSGTLPTPISTELQYHHLPFNPS